METEIVVAIVSATIAGVFQLVGKRMELAHGGGVTTALAPGLPSASIPSSGGVSFGRALRQVGILQLVVNLAAFVVGVVMGGSGADVEVVILAFLFIGTLLLIAGFVWVALPLERAVMWRHLIIVALGVSIITVVINAIILQVPFAITSFLVALVQTFISMGIGGAIAKKIRS